MVIMLMPLGLLLSHLTFQWFVLERTWCKLLCYGYRYLYLPSIWLLNIETVPIMWCVFVCFITLYQALKTLKHKNKIKCCCTYMRIYKLVLCFKAFHSTARICSEVNQYIFPNVGIKYPCWSGAAAVPKIKCTMLL